MAIPSHHTDKRVYVLLLLIVAMLVGMYVISFKKVTTSSQAAGSADQTCIDRTGDSAAYCKVRINPFCKTGFTPVSFTCGSYRVLGNCCMSKTGIGIGGSDTDLICRRLTGSDAAYCVGAPLVKCANGFTSQGSCNLGRRCCVPDAAAAAPTAAPTAVPRAQGTTDSDCGTAHTDCRRTAAAPKCRNISLTGTAIYRCVPEDFRTSPTPRPTAGTIAPNNVCPPPIVSSSGVKSCQTQGYRWGPTQNGAKTCYSICGNLYSTYCGNAKLVDSNSNNNVTPCCGEALSKPFLFSKVCCDKLDPNDIKTRIFGGDQLKAKQTCPAQFPN